MHFFVAGAQDREPQILRLKGLLLLAASGGRELETTSSRIHYRARPRVAERWWQQMAESSAAPSVRAPAACFFGKAAAAVKVRGRRLVGAAVFFPRADQEELLPRDQLGHKPRARLSGVGTPRLISRRWSALHGSAFFSSLSGGLVIASLHRAVDTSVLCADQTHTAIRTKTHERSMQAEEFIGFNYRRDNPWHYVDIRTNPAELGRAHLVSDLYRRASALSSEPPRLLVRVAPVAETDAANFALLNPCLGGSWGPSHALGSPPALASLCSPHLSSICSDQVACCSQPP